MVSNSREYFVSDAYYVCSLLERDLPWSPVMLDLEYALRSADLQALGKYDDAPHGSSVLTLTNHPRQLAHYGLRNPKANIVPYIWDLWPGVYSDFLAAIEICRSPRVGLSIPWAIPHLLRDVPGVSARYIPEAINVERYRSDIPLAQRAVHVIEFGRRFEKWHSAVTRRLSEAGLNHLYAARTMPLDSHFDLFQHRDDLASALGNSLISICFPAGVSHPNDPRTCGVENLTARYLESAAAGCLVIGQSPGDLVDLFGFDPVIPVDWSDPAAQVLGIVAARHAYEQFATRCGVRCREVGDWSARVRPLLELLCE